MTISSTTVKNSVIQETDSNDTVFVYTFKIFADRLIIQVIIRSSTGTETTKDNNNSLYCIRCR
jgi:hypothetical protein